MDEIAPVLFDYAALDTTTRDTLKQHADDIRELDHRIGEDVRSLGAKFDAARQLLRHQRGGGFIHWLEAEHFGRGYAYNCIYVYRLLGKFPNFGNLGIGLSVLYQIAAPSVPEAAVEQIQMIAGTGTPITKEVVEAVVDEVKHPIPPARVGGFDPDTGESTGVPEVPRLSRCALIQYDSYYGFVANLTFDGDETIGASVYLDKEGAIKQANVLTESLVVIQEKAVSLSAVFGLDYQKLTAIREAVAKYVPVTPTEDKVDQRSDHLESEGESQPPAAQPGESDQQSDHPNFDAHTDDFITCPECGVTHNRFSRSVAGFILCNNCKDSGVKTELRDDALNFVTKDELLAIERMGHRRNGNGKAKIDNQPEYRAPSSAVMNQELHTLIQSVKSGDFFLSAVTNEGFTGWYIDEDGQKWVFNLAKKQPAKKAPPAALFAYINSLPQPTLQKEEIHV